MNKKTIITILLALVAMTGLAQKHLPAFQYSKEPAVLCGQIIGNNQQITESVHVRYALKYTSGMGDALRQTSAAVDADGRFTLSLPTGTTVDCHVAVGECRFICYVVPGQTVTFTLDLNKLKTQGLANALMFGGQLADFNHDLVYATEQGIDPETIWQTNCPRRASRGTSIIWTLLTNVLMN